MVKQKSKSTEIIWAPGSVAFYFTGSVRGKELFKIEPYLQSAQHQSSVRLKFRLERADTVLVCKDVAEAQKEAQRAVTAKFRTKAFLSGKRKHKYNAKKVVIDGIEFASELEGERYSDLKYQEQVGMISDLKLQVPYEIFVNDKKICKYTADFVYCRAGKKIIEDAKGFITPRFALVRKLFRAVYDQEIVLWPIRKKKKRRKKAMHSV